MDVSNFAPRIRQILQISDLSTVSAKKVRRQLENEMNMSLDNYKGEIDDIIKAQFQQIHNENQQRQQYAQQYAQQQGQMGLYNVSQAMPGLQMPPGGAMHYHPAGGIPGSLHPGLMHPGGQGVSSQPAQAQASGSAPADGQPRRRGRPRKPENQKQQRKKRVADPDKPRRQTGLSKPMKLSDDLREFLGQKYCARTDVVKNLWKYIKENNLQDPADKRYILCDAQLQKLFECERLYMYTMNKLLNKHLVKPTPEENAEAIVLLDLPPTHPAAADSAGIMPPAGVRKDDGVARDSPVPSEGVGSAASDAQHSEDDDEDDEEQSLPVSPQSSVTAAAGPSASTPLALPPQPAGGSSGSAV
ncbi:hypothetical protein GGI07_002747 [Coemansia sp. Benny D115]|nr:hypothetical protein GGI07_002747 [Coemansia sp. Benny D115]